jgi:hypothetical protein
MDIRDAWRRTLLEWEAIKQYHMPYLLISGQTFRNPFVEKWLPSVMLVKAVAVFDDAVAAYIDTEHGGLPAGYRSDLNGRIRFLGNRGLVSNHPGLHTVRQQRNRVAHVDGCLVTWAEVDSAIAELEGTLLALKLIVAHPRLEYFGERSALSLSSEPGVLGTRTFTIGIREDGKVAYSATWDEKLHRLAPKASGID